MASFVVNKFYCVHYQLLAPFLADSIKLLLAWRERSDYRSRSIDERIAASTALAFAAVSLVISVFSSSLVTSSNIEILVSSPHCGLLSWDGAGWNSYVAVAIPVAESYGPECNRNGSLPSQCNVFTRPRISFTIEVGVPCPFEDQMCASPAVALDSGLVDLNDALGMNPDHVSRVRYRKKTTCAILPHEDYTRIAHSSDDPQELPRAGDFYDEEIIQWLYRRTLRDGIHA